MYLWMYLYTIRYYMWRVGDTCRYRGTGPKTPLLPLLVETNTDIFSREVVPVAEAKVYTHRPGAAAAASCAAHSAQLAGRGRDA